jgi:hypothetical protein
LLIFFLKMLHLPNGYEILQALFNLLRYYKINLDYYTYMRKNRDISPQTTIYLVFGGPKKQVQSTLNVSFLEYRRN